MNFKVLYLKILLLLSVIFLSGCGDTKPLVKKQIDDRAWYGLIGDVKTISEREVEVNSIEENIVEGLSRINFSNTFNQKGYYIESTQYDKGNINQKLVYSYNKNGLKSAVARYDSNESLISKTIFKYDSQNRKIAEINFSADGDETGRLDITYQKNGNLAFEIYKDSQGKVSKNIYKYSRDKEKNVVEEKLASEYKYCLERTTYDKNGNIINWLVGGSLDEWFYDQEGKLKKVIWSDEDGITERLYDDREVLTSESYSGHGTVTLFYQYEYSFDSVGNWIKQTRLKRIKDMNGKESFQPVSITYRDILYY